MKKTKLQGKSDRYGILSGAVILIIFVSVITFMLMHNSFVQTRKAALETLTESASQSAAKLKENMESAANRLEGLAALLEYEGSPDAKKAAVVTGSLKTDSIFSDLAVRLPDGTAVIGENRTELSFAWSEEVPMSHDRAHVTVSRRTTSSVTGKDIIRVFVPVGEGDGRLYGIIETEMLSDKYTSSGFGGNSALIAFEAKSLAVFMDTGSGFDIQGGAIGTLDELVFARGYSKSAFHSDIAREYRGHTIINTDKGRMVCAYLPVGISDWYIMQVVPESILFSQLYTHGISLVAMLCATAAGLIIFAVWIINRAARVRARDKRAEYQVSVRDSILANALSDSSIRVFLYYSDSDRVTVLKDTDGVKQLHRTSATENGLDHIIKTEVLGEDDARKLRNAFSLAGSGKVKKLTVCSHRGGEETFLRYTLTRSKDETGKENIIIGTARDITEFEKTRQKQLDIDLFRNTVVTYKTTGLEIFLESNKWKTVWNNEPVFENFQEMGVCRTDYDSDLERIILPAIHPGDRALFSSAMNRLNLLSDFREGLSEKALQYRIAKKDSADEYEYRVLEIHMLRDKSTDEAKADIYIRNVDKSDLERFSGHEIEESDMRMTDEVFASLSDGCVCAFFAELMTDKIYTVSPDGKTLCRNPVRYDYKKYIYDYAENNIHPEDRCLFVSSSSVEHLEKNLTENTPVVIHYRKTSANNSDEYMPVCMQINFVCRKDGRFEITLIEKRV